MQQRLLLIALMIILVFLHAGLFAQEIVSLLPSADELPGWKIQQGPEVFEGDELFDLIDGGADIYFEYGFTRVVSIDYIDPFQNITEAEIYEMKDATAAYGIFSLTQQISGWGTTYGKLAVVTDDYIAFWKDRYFVNISWASRREVNSKPMHQLAGNISEAITEYGEYPDLIMAFNAVDPGKRAVFMNGNLALSNFYYFDYKDIFEISDAIACTPGDHHRIIFRYQDASEALKVLSAAKQSMMGNKRFTDVSMVYQGYTCKDNKGNVILVSQSGRYIIVLVALDPATSLTPIMEEVILKVEAIQQ